LFGASAIHQQTDSSENCNFPNQTLSIHRPCDPKSNPKK
jgi:hypothetical protein